MPQEFNLVRAAAALVEASLKSDREVAAAFGVSVRSIESWRSRLTWDERLQGEVKKLADQKLGQWVSGIPKFLEDAIQFVRQAAQQGDPTDPEMVEAVTTAIATLNEVMVVQDAIAAKKGRQASG